MPDTGSGLCYVAVVVVAEAVVVVVVVVVVAVAGMGTTAPGTSFCRYLMLVSYRFRHVPTTSVALG